MASSLPSCKAYDIGDVVSCKGIAEGVENSNFLMRTTKGSYILTLYEKRVHREDLPFFLGLMEHLAAKGLSCPTPIKAQDGNALARAVRPAGLLSSASSKACGRAGPPSGTASCWAAAMADFHIKGAISP